MKKKSGFTIASFAVLSMFLLLRPLTLFAYEFWDEAGKWKDSDLPVPYYINQNGSDDVSDGSEFDAIHTSFETWTSVPTTYATAIYRGTTAGVGGPLDWVNIISWVESSSADEYVYLLGPYGSSALAVAAVWSTSEGGEIYMADADIIFNGVDYSWNTSGGASPNTYDIQNVATHEIGHFFGLDHSDEPEATMWPYSESPTEVKRRDLHQDDIDGISALYPYAGVDNFSAVPVSVADSSWIVVSWKNPRRATYQRTMVRYRTDGIHPLNVNDGTLLVEKSGSPGKADFYSHTDLMPELTYYYTAFAYDSEDGYINPNTHSQKSATATGIGGKPGGGGGGGCFVATVCFGGTGAPEVQTLRAFRDRFLRAVPGGENLIRIYYSFGPAAARFLENNPRLKAGARHLLRPAVFIAGQLNDAGTMVLKGRENE